MVHKSIQQSSADVRYKKVIFVHLLNSFSGSPNVLSQVIDATLLNKDVSDVELYIGSVGDGFLSNKDCVTHKYFYRYSRNIFATLLVYFISQIILFCRLLKYRKQNVCIYINTMLPFGAALAGRLMGKDIIYHIHETSIKPAIFKSFLRWIINVTATKVIYVSEYLRCAEDVNVSDKVVIHNCLSEEFFRVAAAKTYSFDSKIFNVFMVCSLKSYKGIGEFVYIAEMFLYKTDVSFSLVLDATSLDIEEFLSEFNIPKNLSIFSSQSSLHHFYCNANLVLNLSNTDQWIETFGLTILEAMSYGIPTIVPPIGGPVELVRDKLDGYLIESHDTSRLYTTILELSNNRELCLKLSGSARKQSLKFSEGIFRRSLKEIFVG